MLLYGTRFSYMERAFTYIVDEKYDAKKIKDVLLNKFLMSSGLITSLKRYEQGIVVNGERQFVSFILKKGDVLKITIVEDASENIEPIFSELEILYEDKDILAVNKRAEMPTHTSIGHHSDTLANAVLYYLNQNGEKHTFHAVTRLDKNTSGVVLIAKNRYAHDLFSRLLRQGKLEKTYMAVACGRVPKRGSIDAKIKRESDSIIKRITAEDGQSAKTLFETKQYRDGYSLVELIPKTGRTHQIRVHMSSIGHPLAGDTLYGGDESANRQLLHCKSLRFIHPITKKKMCIYARLPEDFSI